MYFLEPDSKCAQLRSPSLSKILSHRQLFLKLMFTSREEAGKLIGEKLKYLASEKPVVVGITRGGVVVAAEVAKALSAPLYPLVVKKISSPWNPEFAVGAMGPGGDVVIGDQEIVDSQQIQETRDKIQERIQEYGVGDLGIRIKNRTVIIVDDGIATGWSMKAAIQYVTGLYPVKEVVAVPVADRTIAGEIRKQVGKLVILDEVDGLGAVGNYYEDFGQVGDEEVKRLVDKWRER